jgi:hypothetical protein
MNEYVPKVKDLYNKTINYIQSNMNNSQLEHLAAGVVVTTNIAAIGVGVLSAYIINTLVIRVIWNIVSFIWNLLTPGQQLLELFVVCTSIGTVYAFYKAANEFERVIDETISKLKREIADKDAKIEKLERFITPAAIGLVDGYRPKKPAQTEEVSQPDESP